MDTILSVLKFTWNIFLVLLIFNFMILIHEWGHFLAARWRGLKIEKFQIWFGKPIWKKTYNGVQYGLGWLPLGGFVALPQMAPMEAIEGKTEGTQNRAALPPITPMDKIIVAFFGPLFSFLLAVFFSFFVWWVGKPTSKPELTSTVGWVRPGTPAAASGLKPGDEILSVDGKKVSKWFGQTDSVLWGVISSENDDIKLTVKREGQAEPLEIVVHAPTSEMKSFKEWNEKSLWEKLWERPPLKWHDVGMLGAMDVKVAAVMDHSPAAEAGLRVGDVVKQFNGQPFLHNEALTHYVQENPDKPITLTLLRDGQTTEVTVTPRKPDEPKDFKNSLIGVVFGHMAKNGLVALEHPTPFEQVKESFAAVTNMIAALLNRKTEVSPGHMGSALQIIVTYNDLLSIENGWKLALWFSVLLNINLAILNMLPFPVLDGGHITLAVLEKLRGRQVRSRLLEYVQSLCVLLLLGFMAFVLLKDIGGLAGAGEKDAPDEGAPRFNKRADAVAPAVPAAPGQAPSPGN